MTERGKTHILGKCHRHSKRSLVSERGRVAAMTTHVVELVGDDTVKFLAHPSVTVCSSLLCTSGFDTVPWEISSLQNKILVKDVKTYSFQLLIFPKLRELYNISGVDRCCQKDGRCGGYIDLIICLRLLPSTGGIHGFQWSPCSSALLPHVAQYFAKTAMIMDGGGERENCKIECNEVRPENQHR